MPNVCNTCGHIGVSDCSCSHDCGDGCPPSNYSSSSDNPQSYFSDER